MYYNNGEPVSIVCKEQCLTKIKKNTIDANFIYCKKTENLMGQLGKNILMNRSVKKYVLLLCVLTGFVSCGLRDKGDQVIPKERANFVWEGAIGIANPPALKLDVAESRLAYSDKTVSVINTTADLELHQAWLEFSKAILNQDIELIKSLSSDCILCSDCLVNTPEEDSAVRELQEKNTGQWRKKYKDLRYVSIDQFLAEDLNLIFDDRVKSRLLDGTKLEYNSNNNHNAKLYDKSCIIGGLKTTVCEFKEVLVTHIDTTPQIKGGQRTFSFVKKNGKYKFCGVDTIP